jgi:hypothetical protein
MRKARHCCKKGVFPLVQLKKLFNLYVENNFGHYTISTGMPTRTLHDQYTAHHPITRTTTNRADLERDY